MAGFQLTRRVPAWDGSIVAGNTATLKLPIGLTYHQLWTEYSFSDGVSPVLLENAVDEIRIVANGKPIWRVQASELDLINQYQGRTAAGGILCIDFDRFNLKTRAGQELTAFGTGDANDPTPATTLAIEFDIATGVASGSLDSRAIQSQSSVLGLFKKLRRFNDTFSGAGDYEIDDYPKGDLINAGYFFESANDIDRLVIERDNFIMFDRTKELNSRIQTDNNRVPQTNLYVFDTAEKGYGADQLLTRNPSTGQRVNDLRFRFTVDGAMTVTSVIEYLGALDV